MNLPELLLHKDLGKRAYRLKCRFKIDPNPKPDWLERTKFQAAELWVQDMEKQGWEYDPNKLEKSLRGFTMKGPFVSTPVTGAPSRLEQFRFNAKRDLPKILSGDPMRVPDLSRYVATMPSLGESPQWEYELSAIFIRKTLLVEVPDLKEERDIRQ